MGEPYFTYTRRVVADRATVEALDRGQMTVVAPDAPNEHHRLTYVQGRYPAGTAGRLEYVSTRSRGALVFVPDGVES